MQKDIIIQLRNISKKYQISCQKDYLISSLLKKCDYKEFWALKDINLSIQKGDRIGIVGPNGAGKSTLLKVIAGIVKPSNGSVITKGKIVALTDLEAGFHPDLTGEDNILVNGLLIGMSKEEINAKYQQIINFSDIGEYIHVPFFTYSNGMKFRLAFSLAIASGCEVLIIDEIFVAGDFDFQKKTMKLLKKIQNDRNMTTIMASHVPGFVWNFSDIFYEINGGMLKLMSKQDMISVIRKNSKIWKKTFRY